MLNLVTENSTTTQSKVLGWDCTVGQLNIIGCVLNPKITRLSVCAMTRYGKTRSVALGVLLSIKQGIDLRDSKRVLFIAPTKDQTLIIRNYVADRIAANKELTYLVDKPRSSSPESLKSEVSRKRLTFKNGWEMLTLTAHGAGEAPGKQLMGFGGDIIVLDEACLILDEVYRKRISRMLGDNPNSKLIELVNPWHRNNFAYRHWIDPNFVTIHIGWQQALLEKRVSKAFLLEQKKELTEYEWLVLYESIFAEDAEDSLFHYSWLQRALKRPAFLGLSQKLWGLDVAEKGSDLTVLTPAFTDGRKYNIGKQRVFKQRETMDTATAVSSVVPKKDMLSVDSIGVGAGVHSRLRQLKHFALSIRVSENPTMQPERFLNLKAQKYWQLRELFEADMIKILDCPENRKLIRELSSIRYEFTLKGKIKIIDPSKSPDFADSLMLTIKSGYRIPKVRHA